MRLLKFATLGLLASVNVATAEIVPPIRTPALLRLQLPEQTRSLDLRPALLEPIADGTPVAFEAPAATEDEPEASLADEAQPASIEAVCDTLATAAAANSLPVSFFLRLIWQESKFDPRAVSRAGAQGLAQFMPKVAAEKGLIDPFDPLQALPASARFLRDLRAQFGNLGLAAAAYNAGARRIQDWLAKRGTLPRETRDYVMKITGHAPERWLNTAPQTAAFEAPARAPCKGEEAEQAVAMIEPMPLPVEAAPTAETAKSGRPRSADVKEPAPKKSKARATLLARSHTAKAKETQLAAKKPKAGRREEIAATSRGSRLTARLASNVQIIAGERPAARGKNAAAADRPAKSSKRTQVAALRDRGHASARIVAKTERGLPRERKPTRLAAAR